MTTDCIVAMSEREKENDSTYQVYSINKLALLIGCSSDRRPFDSSPEVQSSGRGREHNHCEGHRNIRVHPPVYRSATVSRVRLKITGAAGEGGDASFEVAGLWDQGWAVPIESLGLCCAVLYLTTHGISFQNTSRTSGRICVRGCFVSVRHLYIYIAYISYNKS